MSGSRINFGRGLDFTGDVAEGGSPKVRVDGGVVIEQFLLVTNLAASEFFFTVEVDGNLRFKLTGEQMLDRESYDGYGNSANEYVFSPADAMAKLQGSELATGLVTKVGQRVEVTLEISENVAAATPEAQLYLETSTGVGRTEVYRLYVLPEVVPITQIGENQYDGFRKAKRLGELAMRRAFFYGSVDKYKIEQEDRAVIGKRMLPSAVNNNRLKRYGKNVPANCTVYDPIVRGNVLGDVLDLFTTVTPTRLTAQTADSDDLLALVEYVQDMRLSNAE